MTISWNIDRARGRLSFGKLAPMTGNTYQLTVSGREEGKTYAFFVFGEDVKTAVAASEYDETEGTYSIAFNTEELRKCFRQEWHEVRVFHVTASDGENTVAEGDLTVFWNPVWTDPVTGRAYTMRGEPGIPGAPGRQGIPGKSAYEIWLEEGNEGSKEDFLTALRGPAGTERYAYCEDTDKYHRVYLSLNDRGELVWAVDETAISADDIASESSYVMTIGAQTITGEKTFNGLIKANGGLKTTTAADTENSTAAATTAWVRTRITNWWTNLCQTVAAVFTQQATFNGGAVMKSSSSVPAGATLTVNGTLQAPTAEDADNSRNAATTAWVRTRIANWWTGIKDTAITWTKKHTFSAGIEGNVTGNVTGNLTGNVTGNVTGDVTGDVTGSLDATGAGKSALVPTVSDLTDISKKAVNLELLRDIIGKSYKTTYIPFNGSYVVEKTITGLIPNATYLWHISLARGGNQAAKVQIYLNDTVEISETPQVSEFIPEPDRFNYGQGYALGDERNDFVTAADDGTLKIKLIVTAGNIVNIWSVYGFLALAGLPEPVPEEEEAEGGEE